MSRLGFHQGPRYARVLINLPDGDTDSNLVGFGEGRMISTVFSGVSAMECFDGGSGGA